MAITPPPATFPARAAPSLPPPSQLAAPVARGDGVWAVVVGINDYPGSRSDLVGSVNDASNVDAALAGYGIAPERRVVLRDRQASAATIRAALQWLVDHAGPDATAVLFYAGHVRKLSAAREAIVAADGQLVTDADVAAALGPLQARRVWIAIAACYAAGFTEALGPGRVLTAAAGADDLAYENRAYGGSYLVEFMVRRAMVEGRAAESVEAAFSWAAAELRRAHPDRVPVQDDRAAGDIRLGPTPPPAAAPAAPPPSASSPQPEPPEEGVDGDDQPPQDAEDRCVVRLGALLGCDD